VLYRFKSDPDGAHPSAGLIDVKGALYGTTTLGGGGGSVGTVFKVSRSGIERVLYTFGCCGSDAANPVGDLLAVNGVLYGTTESGGPSFNGAVFKVSTSGKERVLYYFKGGFGSGPYDGAQPAAALILVNGALYGTTYNGGRYGCGYDKCDGTVFKISP
jgi:uncharacterized repeat protein (TIGR03803 family)